MLEHVEIENFQSLANVSIPLGRLTVIVGPSGRGKSSFVRALSALCFNQVPRDFLRRNTRKARVTLTFDGGQQIEWEKAQDKGAAYGFNDQQYTRTGRTAPEDISQALAVRRLEIEKGTTFRPQFHGQHDPPLLLSDTSTLAARILARLTRLYVLVEAQVACRRDRMRADRQHAAAEEERERAETQLAEMPNLRPVQKMLEKAERGLDGVEKKMEVARRAVEIAEDIRGVLRIADVRLPSEEEMALLELRVARLVEVDAAVNKLSRLEVAAEAGAEGVKEREKAVEEAQEEHDALVEELGACPMCGSTEKWGTDA